MVLLELRLGDDGDDEEAAAGCECSALPSLSSPQCPGCVGAVEMCSQSRGGSAQLSHLTPQRSLVDLEQTHSHRIFHKEVQFTWPGQITNLTSASAYFLCCLLIYWLSIQINACLTLTSGNLGVHYQHGTGTFLSHCISERLLDFPHLFSRKVIFLCCMYVFNCSHDIHDVLVSHPIWPFWKHPFSFFKEQNTSLIVKPRVINSSGEMPQATMDLTQGMSLVPLQRLTVSPPKERANAGYTNAFHRIQDNLFLLLFHLCLTTTAALLSGFVLGDILFKSSHSPCKLCYTRIIAVCFRPLCSHCQLPWKQLIKVLFLPTNKQCLL